MRATLVLICISLFTFLNAQIELGLLDDTLHINEVFVKASPLVKYQAGSKTQKIDTLSMLVLQSANLSELISRNAPIYIKSNAGGLATIRFRGTSPDHTSVMFGAININSLTLGHSNLATIPNYLFDNVELQYGNSSSVHGSGAIGGSIHLQINNTWTEGVKTEVRGGVGSFNEKFIGGKIYVGNGKLESVTRVYQHEKENNFPFLNKYTNNIENKGGISDVQRFSAVYSKGLLQEFNIKLRPKEFILFKSWFQDEWHEIQPNASSNYLYPNEPDTLNAQVLTNNNIRLWTDYKNTRGSVDFSLGAGYVHDMQIDESRQNQHIGTDRFVSEAYAEKKLAERHNIKLGGIYKYIVPNVYAYNADQIKSENHADLYVSYYTVLIRKLKISANIRKPYVPGFKSPFTPALGSEYIMFSSYNKSLSLLGSVSRSYRIPTFNDRFWGDDYGNKNLKAEDGISTELGTDLKISDTKLSVNVFYKDIHNWIQWRDIGSGIWKAQNIQEVESKGVEISFKQKISNLFLNPEIGCNYTFNIVEPVKVSDDNYVENVQLTYVPKHIGNAWLNLSYNKLNANIQSNFVGERSYSYIEGEVLEPYSLINSSLSYSSSFKNHKITIIASADNLLNTYYENRYRYAMPGRAFRLNLVYNFK